MQELNIDAEEVESLMVSCILDSTVHGCIDQVQQILEVDHEPQGSARYATLHIFAIRLNTRGERACVTHGELTEPGDEAC